MVIFWLSKLSSETKPQHPAAGAPGVQVSSLGLGAVGPAEASWDDRPVKVCRSVAPATGEAGRQSDRQAQGSRPGSI